MSTTNDTIQSFNTKYLNDVENEKVETTNDKFDISNIQLPERPKSFVYAPKPQQSILRCRRFSTQSNIDNHNVESNDLITKIGSTLRVVKFDKSSNC